MPVRRLPLLLVPTLASCQGLGLDRSASGQETEPGITTTANTGSGSDATAEVTSGGTEVEVIRLAHTSASEMAATVRDRMGGSGTLRILADQRGNALLVTGTRQEIRAVQEMVASLDLEVHARGKGH